jgi:hypothetical protein
MKGGDIMKKISKIVSAAATGTAFYLFNTGVVFAQANTVDINLRPNNLGQFVNITPGTFVTGAIRLVMVIAALAFFFTLVIGGIQWILSGGDKTGAETSRKKITGALIGLAIVFLAWAISVLIKVLFDFDVLNLQFGQFY